MSFCRPIGYYTDSHESHHLIHCFGDLLDQLNANEKVGLIAALSLWLAMDDIYGDPHWTIPVIANTQLFPESANLSKAASIVEEIAPNDALDLIAALIEQVRSGVYAE